MKRSICLLALFALAAAPSSYAEQGNMQAALASLKDAQASLLKVILRPLQGWGQREP